ncbi:MAG: SEC-C domain-containing protein [Lachnospiraceae bacterium]|nr:SEC-C domain-containing protein [Lachnospiraceae bacterium]
MEEKSLLQTWRELAYNQQQTQQQYDQFWNAYFLQEIEVYKDILGNPDVVVKGTVKDLAAKYNMELLTMVGFLDGINESLKVENPIDTMTEDTEVSLEYDKESLYKNMVEARAEWLYNLEQWDALLTPERRKELYKEQKSSHTVVKEKKIGRNDPCPCGSGKKYKFCCGR